MLQKKHLKKYGWTNIPSVSCQVPALVTSDFSVMGRKLSLTVVGHRTTKKEEGLFDKSTALRSVLHIPQCLNCYI